MRMNRSLISEECSIYLLSNNSEELLQFQSISGLGFNKLGSYSECISSDAEYYLIKGVTEYIEQNKFTSGICFKKLCHPDDLIYAMHSLMNYVNLPFNVSEISTPSSIIPDFDLQTIILSSILGTLVLTTLVATVFDLLSHFYFKKGDPKVDKMQEWLSVFSLASIATMLGNRRHSSHRIPIFYGVKIVALFGIILMNVLIITAETPATQLNDDLYAAYFLCFYSTDLWLMVSGFYLSYTLLEEYAKLQRVSRILLKAVLRFLRLWPLYIISLLFNWKLLPYLGSGPLWPLIITFPNTYCVSAELSHLLMVSNLSDSHCYNWLWVFEVDVQLCIAMALLLAFYIKKTKKIMRVLFYLIQAALVALSLVLSLQKTEKNIYEYYFPGQHSGFSISPLCRVGGYLIGFNLGISYYEFKKSDTKGSHWAIKLFTYKALKIAVEILPFACIGLLGLLLSFKAQNTFDTGYILTLASMHTLLPLLCCVSIAPGLFGFASPWKSVLCSRLGLWVSKFSLCIYSMHYSVLLYFIYNRKSDLELSNLSVLLLAVCCLVPSLLSALALFFLIEKPIFALKMIYDPKNRNYLQH